MRYESVGPLEWTGDLVWTLNPMVLSECWVGPKWSSNLVMFDENLDIYLSLDSLWDVLLSMGCVLHHDDMEANVGSLSWFVSHWIYWKTLNWFGYLGPTQISRWGHIFKRLPVLWLVVDGCWTILLRDWKGYVVARPSRQILLI